VQCRHLNKVKQCHGDLTALNVGHLVKRQDAAALQLSTSNRCKRGLHAQLRTSTSSSDVYGRSQVLSARCVNVPRCLTVPAVIGCHCPPGLYARVAVYRGDTLTQNISHAVDTALRRGPHSQTTEYSVQRKKAVKHHTLTCCCSCAVAGSPDAAT
jgi:hypothetical protein